MNISSEDVKEEHDHSTLLAERDRTLDSLEELDFDYASGKVPAEDYPSQRKALINRGAYILRELDKFEAQASEVQAEARFDSTIEARRTAAQEDAQAQPASDTFSTTESPTSAPLIEDDDVEALIAARRRMRSDKSAGFCPQCGNAVTKSDRFCSKCGNALS